MRKTLFSGLLLVFAVPLAFGSLPAPEKFDAAVVGNVIQTSWDPVANADKYSVKIVAAYDTDGNAEIDVYLVFDFGTSDRTDGYPMSDPFLDIPLSALEISVDTDNDGIPDTQLMPLAGAASVKALNPGKGKGRQDNPFSNVVELEFPE